MPCVPFKSPDGSTGIMCFSRRGQRCACGNAATKLCDWRVAEKRSGTCDKPLCGRCAISPAPEKDLCQAHAAEWEARGRPSAPVGAPVQASLFEEKP